MTKFIILLLTGLFFTVSATASGVTDCTGDIVNAITKNCEQNSSCKNGCSITNCKRTLSDSSACTGTCRYIDQGVIYDAIYRCK
jgi:hypothetical protein